MLWGLIHLAPHESVKCMMMGMFILGGEHIATKPADISVCVSVFVESSWILTVVTHVSIREKQPEAEEFY